MKSEIREDFVRQRRALVATSLALIAFQGLGATLDKVTLLGNTIDLASPLSVTTPLWIAWGYFFLRYYQYFRDLGDKGFKDITQRRTIDLARKAALKQVKGKLRDAQGSRKTKIRIDKPDMQRMSSDGPWTFRVQGGMAYITNDKSETVLESIVGREVVLPHGEPRFSRVRSTLWALFNAHQGTEYGLPFLVGALPPLVAVLTLLC